MRRIFTTISTLLICGLLTVPTADAQGRGRNDRNNSGCGQRTEQRQSRPGNMGHRPGNNNRPNNNNNRPGNNDRPNNRPGNNDRPNNRPGNNDRPGNRPGNNHNRPGHNNGYRPGHNDRPNHDGYRPGHNDRPNHNGYRPGHNGYRPGGPQGGGHFKPGYRPNHRPMPPYHVHGPHRPYMPAPRPWHRPTPPPHFRPRYGAPNFATILGVTIGTALNISINALMNSGYDVVGYGPASVYLNNVPMLNYTWPNATLSYVNGNLAGSEFVYSTPYYDMSRYNMLYSQLINQYGYPTTTQSNGGGSISSTWWGYNDNFVTLSYFPDYATNGTLRYYTSLTFGR